MHKFEYQVTATQMFTNAEDEFEYLNNLGSEGWELVAKETVQVKKRVTVVLSPNDSGISVLYKFYWKRKQEEVVDG